MAWIRRYRVFIFALSLISLLGCFTPSQESLLQFGLPLPTKDEVAVVNGRPITIDHYLTIRHFLNTTSAETILWVCIATIAIQNEAQSRNRELSPSHALEIARYAIGEMAEQEASGSLQEFYGPSVAIPVPAQVLKDIESLTNRSVIHKNHQALSMLY
jgi:hypothetical protein